MRGAARWDWQHSVPPVPRLRYSVTMRTVRPGAVRSAQPSAESSTSVAGSAAIAISVDSDTSPAT